MKKLMIKILLNLLMHVLCSLLIFQLGFSFVYTRREALILEISIILFLQLPIYKIYQVKRSEKEIHRMIYWVISLILTLATAYFWLIEIVGPLWIE